MKQGRAGYVGYPAAATAAFGEAALAAFLEVAYERMTAAMSNPKRERWSAVTRWPFLRPGWRRTFWTIVVLGGATLIGILIGRITASWVWR
jgi:hypothetical protein